MSVSKHGHESDVSTKEIRDGNPDLILFYLRFSSRFSILCVLSMVYGATRKDKANEIERSATGVAFAWARKLFLSVGFGYGIWLCVSIFILHLVILWLEK